ncbi:hypothetical protein M5E87_08410 [Flavonifractor plautii]|nr:hypothetical protein M5E87_08410 [Flavonifractor plautii]
MLMERDGLNAAEQSPLPSAPANRAVWEAASQAFVHASLTRCGGPTAPWPSSPASWPAPTAA